jgi:hypothetical protein
MSITLRDRSVAVLITAGESVAATSLARKTRAQLCNALNLLMKCLREPAVGRNG